MVARPRKTAKRDYSHQIIKRKSVYVLYFYYCPSEKDREAGLLAPDHNKKEHLCSLFLWSPVRERLRSSLTRTIFLSHLLAESDDNAGALLHHPKLV